MNRNGKRSKVCKQVRGAVPGFPSKTSDTKAAYLAAKVQRGDHTLADLFPEP